MRSQLALCLQGVVAQQLVPRRGGGRVALYEVLLTNTAVASLIREGKSHQLPGLLQMGGQSGMQTLRTAGSNAGKPDCCHRMRSRFLPHKRRGKQQ